MDGLLAVDKPTGPTSHDVVARVRRVLRERAVGHTGTLDPMASGLLPLVVGRATRLARFVSAGDKRYLAVVRLGFSTDTYDAMGEATTERAAGAWPEAAAIDRALDAFRGSFVQQPPAYSAKKVGGERSYRLARNRSRALRGGTRVGTAAVAPGAAAESAVLPVPVPVTAMVDVMAADADRVTLQITCSSGFYVRSLAHDLGQALGVGAHLAELRRTGTSGLVLANAVTLAALEAPDGAAVAHAALVGIDRMLPAFPGVALTDRGADRARTGRDVGPEDAAGAFPPLAGPPGPFRLLDPAGRLVAIGEWAANSGLLHPAVVLV